ncbi:unnamed protein product [Prunus armeniaca]
MLVTLAREKVRLSQEVHNLYDTFAYKSPKKRTREVMEEIEEESDPSVRWWEKASRTRAEVIAQRLGFNEYHEHFIHRRVQDLNNHKTWYSTFVYIYPQKDKHKPLWPDIFALKPRISEAWFYPNCVMQNLPIMRSDHGPICLMCPTVQRNKPKAFKFEAMWLSHQDFPLIVNQAWNVTYQGIATHRLTLVVELFNTSLRDGIVKCLVTYFTNSAHFSMIYRIFKIS